MSTVGVSWCTAQCQPDYVYNGFSAQHVYSPHMGQPHAATSGRNCKDHCKPKQAKKNCPPMSDTAPSAPVTICFKNIPNFYNRAMLLELLDSNGFKGSYDFIHVPHSFKRLPTLVSLGYFFVNFASHEVALRAWATFVGFKDWVKPSDKVMEATWATTTQGQKACIEKFQNSRVNGASVPPEYDVDVESRPTQFRVNTLDRFVFEGTWTTSCGITERIPTNGVKVTGATTCELTLGAETFTGAMQSDGQILWSDGDIWTKQDFSDLHALVGSEAVADDIDGMAASKISSASSSTTGDSVDSELGVASADSADDASESEMHSMCFATETWPVSRKSVRWCDVTDEEPAIEMGSTSSRQKKGLGLTLLQSTFEHRGTGKSICLKNTFIEFDETPIAASRTRFASSFM